VATLEWIPPPKPYRNQDALYKTARPVADGQGLRQAGRGDLNPHRRSQSLHGPWHTSHRGRRVSPSGEKGSPTLIRLVQQSPSKCSGWQNDGSQKRCSEDQRGGKAQIAVHRSTLTPKHFDFGRTEQRQVMAADKVYLEMYLPRASPAKYPVYSRS
jgi:hypothetical protein